MKLTKLRLTKDASNRLRFVAGKTGLTPNILCRIGFCLSLRDPLAPNQSEYSDEDREFNRYTLLGEFDELFIALMRQRSTIDGLNSSNLPDYFRAHMNRGVMLLHQRVKSLSDIASLIHRASTAKEA
jgi:DNA sulfur modification protein DndE